MAYEDSSIPQPPDGSRTTLGPQSVRPAPSAPPPMNDAEQDKPAPVKDVAQMQIFGDRMLKTFEQYKKDRRHVEEQLLRNLRQYRGIYDPEVEKGIKPDQSKAYPKITRQKVIGTVARLMEMLFPETEKNWGIEPTSCPDLSTEDLQSLLTQIGQENAQNGNGQPLTDEVIEAAIMKFSKERADKMALTIEDQLNAMDYVNLVKQVVRSGVMLCMGVAQGPFIKTVKTRTWAPSGPGGQYVAKEVQKLRPWYDFVSIWDYYPDLSAKSITQMDGQFRRHVMPRQGVRDLADRPDFFKEEIMQWLKDHDSGNFQEQYWERELRWKGDKQNITDLTGRKYELYEWWGQATSKDLIACGIDVDDDGEMYEASVWGIGNTIIKSILNPLGKPGEDRKVNMFHHFIYEEDDISLMGNGMPAILRDSQMAICEASRMMLDNASVVCGPMLEVDIKRLSPGQDMDIYARKVWVLDPDVDLGPSNQTPAVREIKVDSHINDLQQIIELFMKIGDQESALPPPAMGDTSGQGKEPYRTSAGMSMLFGAAALPLRDVVRNFDQFTSSFIGSLYQWNLAFNEDSEIRGDFDVKAKGSTSLIAKEVRAQAIDQFHATMSEDEKVYISPKKMLLERMKTRDIPMDILEEDDVVQQRLVQQAQQAQEQYQWSQASVQAQVRNILAEAFKNIALGRKASVASDVASVEAVLEVLANAINGTTGNPAGGTGSETGNNPGGGKPGNSGNANPAPSTGGASA